MPVCLARRVKKAAVSRTWVTLPGVLSTDSSCITWMESSTTTLGLCKLDQAAIASPRVSEATCSRSAGNASRCARRASWCRDSSPVT